MGNCVKVISARLSIKRLRKQLCDTICPKLSRFHRVQQSTITAVTLISTVAPKSLI